MLIVAGALAAVATLAAAGIFALGRGGDEADRELGADFDLSGFAHDAFYNAPEGRIEIYLRSLRSQVVTVAGRRFSFSAGVSARP